MYAWLGNSIGPALRAGFTDVLVTGIEISTKKLSTGMMRHIHVSLLRMAADCRHPELPKPSPRFSGNRTTAPTALAVIEISQ